MTKNVELKLNSYPAHVRAKIVHLRQLILDTAAGMTEVGPIEETLKWGELAI